MEAIKASAWRIEKPGHPEFGRWRGFIMRRGGIGYQIAWDAAETHETVAAATAFAQAHLRRERKALSTRNRPHG